MEETQLEQAVLCCVDPSVNPEIKKQVTSSPSLILFSLIRLLFYSSVLLLSPSSTQILLALQALTFLDQMKAQRDSWRFCLHYFLSKPNGWVLIRLLVCGPRVTFPPFLLSSSNEAKFFALQVLDDTLTNKIDTLTGDDRLLLKQTLVTWMRDEIPRRTSEPACMGPFSFFLTFLIDSPSKTLIAGSLEKQNGQDRGPPILPRVPDDVVDLFYWSDLVPFPWDPHGGLVFEDLSHNRWRNRCPLCPSIRSGGDPNHSHCKSILFFFLV